MGAQSRKRLTNPVWGDVGVLLEEMNQDEGLFRMGRKEKKQRKGFAEVRRHDS